MIQLPQGLVLIADDHCFIVGKAKKDRGRGVEVQNPTYHTSVAQAAQSALNRIMRTVVKDGSVTTLRQFIEEQERLKHELKELLAPLEPGGKAVQLRGEGNNPFQGGKDTTQEGRPSDG